MTIIKKFTVDTKRAKEGDWVSVCWECITPDAVFLSTDNGYKTERISLADAGTTSVYISNSKGATKVTLVAVLGSRKESKTETIQVSNLKAVKAKPAGVSRFRLLNEKAHARWCQTKFRFQYWWQYLPKKKKTLYKVLFFLWLSLLAATILSPSGKGNRISPTEAEQISTV